MIHHFNFEMGSKYLSVMLIILLSTCSLGFSNQETSLREYKIGGFDFSSNFIKEKKLVRLYGKGCVDEDYAKHTDHYRRIYFFPERNIYAAFDIGTDKLVVGLRLTTELLSSKMCKSVRKLKYYETGKLIALGDRKDKVIKAYGKPSEERTKPRDVILYRYYVGRDEGPYMEIEFSNERVSSIWITAGD
jgi:hypothetical protein